MVDSNGRNAFYYANKAKDDVKTFFKSCTYDNLVVECEKLREINSKLTNELSEVKAQLNDLNNKMSNGKITFNL